MYRTSIEHLDLQTSIEVAMWDHKKEKYIFLEKYVYLIEENNTLTPRMVLRKDQKTGKWIAQNDCTPGLMSVINEVR